MTSWDLSSPCPDAELAVGWALHCLEPEDEAFVSAHLPGCSHCARTVGKAEEVGAVIALTLPRLEPPVELRRRILAAAEAASPFLAEVAAGPTSVPKLSSRRRPLGGQRVLFAASGLLVAVTVGVGINADRVGSDRNELASQRGAASTVLSQVLDGMADPGVERTALTTVDGSPMAVVLTRDSDASLTVIAVHLPGNRTDSETYVLWGLAGHNARALVAFDVTVDRTVVFTRRSEPTASFAAFAVSLEPGRMAPIAPSRMVASGEIAS